MDSELAGIAAVKATTGTFLTADQTKLDGIETSATADQTDAEIKTAVEASSDIALGGNPTTTTQSASDNSTKIATTAYTDAQVATVVDSAPGTLNTLNELAAALGDDANFSTTTATNIAAKMPLAGGAFSGAVTTNSTFDGVDIATRDGVLTSTTTTANAALPKAGGTMTGALDVGAQAFVNSLKIGDRSLTNGEVSISSGWDGVIRLNSGSASTFFFNREIGTDRDINFWNGGTTSVMLIKGSNQCVGIGTSAPGQLLDVNSGGGNIIADGYDTHSLAIYKENIEDASGYLDKVLACPAQKWNRKPFVSADEIKEAVLEEFGEDVLIEEAVEAQDAVYEDVEVTPATEAVDAVIEQRLVSEAIEAKDAVYEKQYSVWDELFSEENSHRQKALYNMPDGDLKTWIDDWCEAKRVEMRPEDKWQKKRLGLVADAELTAEHLPEVVSINNEGEPTGIDTMTYIGILHNAIQELSAKVEALENP
jgi:hypothetical protein